MNAPKETCPKCSKPIKPVDRGAYWTYSCCTVEIKNYKPPSSAPGEKKRFAPEG